MGIAVMRFGGSDGPSHNKGALYSSVTPQSEVSIRQEELLAHAIAQLGNPLTVCTRLPATQRELKHCSVLLLRLDSPADKLNKIMTSAAQHGITVILTPADPDTSPDPALACRADFLITTESELESFTGKPIHSFAQREEAGKILLNLGLKNLIITLGDQGCLWMSQGKTRHVAAYKVNTADTHAAPEAFIGCFAHYYAKDSDILNALEHASLYAACCASRTGTARTFPSLAEFQVFRP